MMIWRSLDNALLIKMLRSLMLSAPSGTDKSAPTAQNNLPKPPAG